MAGNLMPQPSTVNNGEVVTTSASGTNSTDTETGRKLSLIKFLQERSKAASKFQRTKVIGFPKDKIPELIEKMKCSRCSAIPLPGSHYRCSKGHLYCAPCAEDQLSSHDGKCDFELGREPRPMVRLEKRSKLQRGPPSIHINYCRNDIQPCPTDPLFLSLWNQTSWKCPIHPECAGGPMTGSQLLTHIFHPAPVEVLIKVEETDPVPQADNQQEYIESFRDLQQTTTESGQVSIDLSDIVDHVMYGAPNQGRNGGQKEVTLLLAKGTGTDARGFLVDSEETATSTIEEVFGPLRFKIAGDRNSDDSSDSTSAESDSDD